MPALPLAHPESAEKRSFAEIRVMRVATTSFLTVLKASTRPLILGDGTARKNSEKVVSKKLLVNSVSLLKKPALRDHLRQLHPSWPRPTPSPGLASAPGAGGGRRRWRELHRMMELQAHQALKQRAIPLPSEACRQKNRAKNRKNGRNTADHSHWTRHELGNVKCRVEVAEIDRQDQQKADG